jgi:hypothetical protein
MSNTPATPNIRKQDDTVPRMHKTLTMFFFSAGYISSARCTSTFSIIFATDCRFSCNFPTAFLLRVVGRISKLFRRMLI